MVAWSSREARNSKRPQDNKRRVLNKEVMKDRMERLVVLPFSIGCTSQSSVDVSENHPKKMKQEPISPPPRGGESLSGVKTKNSFGFLPLPKSNISSGLHKLIKGFKSLSQLFVYKEDDDEMGMEMEIGLPTDVKHVTHIGWDGSTTTNNSMKVLDGLKAPELLSLPSISLRQFELAMAAQADASLANAPPVRFT